VIISPIQAILVSAITVIVGAEIWFICALCSKQTEKLTNFITGPFSISSEVKLAQTVNHNDTTGDSFLGLAKLLRNAITGRQGGMPPISILKQILVTQENN